MGRSATLGLRTRLAGEWLAGRDRPRKRLIGGDRGRCRAGSGVALPILRGGGVQLAWWQTCDRASPHSRLRRLSTGNWPALSRRDTGRVCRALRHWMSGCSLSATVVSTSTRSLAPSSRSAVRQLGLVPAHDAGETVHHALPAASRMGRRVRPNRRGERVCLTSSKLSCFLRSTNSSRRRGSPDG